MDKASGDNVPADEVYVQQHRDLRAGVWLPAVVTDAVRSFKAKTLSVGMADVLCERFDWLQSHSGWNSEFDKHGTYLLFDDQLRPR